MDAVVIRRRALALALVAALGCVRWRPLASADLAREAPTLALRTLRVADREGLRELRVHRVQATVVEGWDAARGVEARVDLAAARQAWVREADDVMNALLVGGAFAFVFVVSWFGLLIDR